jgi:hypothetical protein
MAVYRAHVAIGADGPLARDRFVITPHFTSSVGGEDFNAFAAAVNTACQGTMGGSREYKTTIYLATGPKPHPPLGTATANANSYPVSNQPRELAICLSYYSGVNMPRRRGRLYVPAACLGFTTAALRPSSSLINPVKDLGAALAAAGGANWTWCVYSRRDGAGFPVTNYYVDNEWDVIRSRGLRPDSRESATTTG